MIEEHLKKIEELEEECIFIKNQCKHNSSDLLYQIEEEIKSLKRMILFLELGLDEN